MFRSIRKALAPVSSLTAIVFIVLIRIYRKTVSPDHGPLRHLYPHGYCRHEPTCSSYAIDALKTRSLPVALFLIAKRILSCHPWKEVSEEKMKTMIDKTLEKHA